METSTCELKTLTERYAGFWLDVIFIHATAAWEMNVFWVRSQMVGTPPCGLFCWIPNCVHATFCTGNRSA